MKRFLLTLAFCVSLISAAFAQGGMGPGPGTVHSTGGGGPYVGPGDLQAFPLWGGLRAFSAATAGTKAANVCNVADVICADMSTDATTGNLVITTIGGSSCAVVTCTIKTLYDKSGNNLDFTNTTIATRPTLVVNCVNSLPCMAFNGSQFLQTTSFGTQNQPLSFSAVGMRLSGTGFQPLMAAGSAIAIYFNNSANQIILFAGSLSSAASQTDGQWHNIQCVFNGASSVIDIDNTLTTVNPGTNAVSAGLVMGSEASFTFFLTGQETELGFLNTGLTTPQMNAIDANQHAYWGTGL